MCAAVCHDFAAKHNLTCAAQVAMSTAQDQKQFYLTVGSIFKNEAESLREWLDHHFMEGVDHVLLVDNNSTDDFMPVLQPYIDQGRVTLMVNPKKHAQVEIINHNFYQLRDITEWILHIDLDEFVYARTGTIADYLRQCSPDMAAISIPWKGYGSSGHVQQPKGSIVKNCVMRGNASHDTTKTIARTSLLAELYVHNAAVRSDLGAVRMQLNVGPVCGTNYSCLTAMTTDRLHLNHYALQSLEWFQRTKMGRGDVARAELAHVRDLSYFHAYDYIMNHTLDQDLYLKHQAFYDSL